MSKDEFSQEMRPFKKFILWLILVFIVGTVIVFILRRSVNAVDKGISRYEEFQDIYNSCKKIDTDICNMHSLEGSDPMFQQFSKAQRINALQTNLNRWIEEYNAKSKTWTRSMWKGKSLPTTLSIEDFNCYQKSKQAP